MYEVQLDDLRKTVKLWEIRVSWLHEQMLYHHRGRKIEATPDELQDALGAILMATSILASDIRQVEPQFNTATLFRIWECASLWIDDRSRVWFTGFRAALFDADGAVLALIARKAKADPVAKRAAHADDGISEMLYRAVMSNRTWRQARGDVKAAGYTKKVASDQSAIKMVKAWCKRHKVEPPKLNERKSKPE